MSEQQQPLHAAEGRVKELEALCAKCQKLRETLPQHSDDTEVDDDAEDEDEAPKLDVEADSFPCICNALFVAVF